jgi:UPF0755 protein
MKGKFLRYFNVLFLFAIAFALFYMFNDGKQEEVVIIPHGTTSEDAIEQMVKDGFIKKGFSYYVLKLKLALGGTIEPGGYNLKKGMGAVTAALNLQEPEYRFVVVNSGQRKGEIAESIGDVLEWDEETVYDFYKQYPVCKMTGDEGYYASGKYLIHKDEDPDIIQLKMQESFVNKIKEIELSEENETESDLIRIASLIQREAAGKNDMRLISGIIWNRLELGMPLQIDATLQYIKGEEGNWWPVPKSEDKFIDSEFNTYQIEGLPPTPIATPSEAALKAAANPVKTDCLFYLHDERGNIHCSTNYEGHKRNVNYYLK